MFLIILFVVKIKANDFYGCLFIIIQLKYTFMTT